MAFISGIIAGFGLILGISLIISAVLFILKGIGIYGISKNLELKNPWICFIPVLDTVAIGRIAEKYQKADGKKSARFSILLPVFYLLSVLLIVAVLVLFVVGMVAVSEDAQIAAIDDSMMAMEAFAVLIPAFVAYLFALAAIILYEIFYFISLWRIYAMLDNNSATVYLILSIIFSFLTPFFLLSLKKCEPKLTYAQRMGFEEPIFEVKTNTVETEN